ncbi:MAG TPA: tetraacyldisaccharide 4'-kinase [Candidatus Binataceae bacterium]|nr:tetraacyldisaccharide 4'-kinase [Candidatus Binataceae bacterium]
MNRRTPARERPKIERLWQPDLPLRLWPLWMGTIPLAMAYRVGLGARSLFWRAMRKGTDVRTVSVGNLTVGGNGKTPFTLFLANRLAARGLRVGIVSRGFAGTNRARAAMVSDGREIMMTPEESGDEPIMMAKSFSGPVAIAKRRIDGIRLLKEAANPDIVILDDAFQHIRLKRDVDLVLINRERGLGNGWLLPAGPMRESGRALRRADAIILVSGTVAGGGRQVADAGSEKSQKTPVLNATIRPRALVHVEKGRWVESAHGIAGRRVVALSGLADPRGFYAMLHELDADLVGVLEYPDHYQYSSDDWHEIVTAARDDALIITTEKDLVKLERFPFARDSLYALRLEVTMSPGDAAILDEIVIGGGEAIPNAAQA